VLHSDRVDVLQRRDWHGAPIHLGEVFLMRKNGVEARCVLRTHQFGWELCLQVGISRDFVRSQVCRTANQVLDGSEQWKASMVENGWR
jgi:hypothetical protein